MTNIECLNGSDLTSFLNQAEIADRLNIFQQPAWLDAIEDGLGYKRLGLLSIHEGHYVSISLYLTCVKGSIIKMAGGPLPGCFTPYLNTLWLNESPGDDLKLHVLLNEISFLKRNNYSYIERRLNENVFTQMIPPSSDWEISYPETYIVNIKGDHLSMWQKMEGRSRNMVRKAEKSGVTMSKCSGSADEINLFYNMLQIVFTKRREVPPHSIELYRSIVKHLLPHQKILILSAVQMGKPIAMGIFIHDDEEIHFLSGASIPEANGTGANNLMHWEVIKYAVDHGLKFYNLGGKGILSIDKFKKSFGGDVHGYVKIVWRSQLTAVAEKIYRKLHALKGRVACHVGNR